jgi:hypothetical protein
VTSFANSEQLTVTNVSPTASAQSRIKRLSSNFKRRLIQSSPEQKKSQLNDSLLKNKSSQLNSSSPTTSNSSLSNNNSNYNHEVARSATPSMSSVKSDLETGQQQQQRSRENKDLLLFKKAVIKRRSDTPREALRVSLSAKNHEKSGGIGLGVNKRTPHEFRSDANLYDSETASRAADYGFVPTRQSSKPDLSKTMQRNVIRKTLKLHPLSKLAELKWISEKSKNKSIFCFARIP